MWIGFAVGENYNFLTGGNVIVNVNLNETQKTASLKNDYVGKTFSTLF